MTGSTEWLRALAAAWFAGGEGHGLARTAQALVIALATLSLAWPVLARRRATRHMGLALHWAVLAVTVLLLRLPAIFAGEMNPDESHELAEALTLLRDPAYWHSADGQTHGPLTPFSLLAMHAAGLSLDYGTARLFPVLTIVLAAAAAFAVCRRFLSMQAAQLASAVSAIALGAIGIADMQAFNAEYVGLFVVAAWVFPALRLTGETSPAQRWTSILSAGVLIGLLPFAKLQFAPMAALLAAITIGVLLSTRRGRARRVEVTAFAVATAGGVASLLGLVWTGGGWSHFLVCYIRDNLEYMDMVQWAPGEWAGFAGIVATALGPSALTVSVAAGVGHALAADTGASRRLPPRAWLATAAFLLVAVYSAYRPGRAFPHYLNLVAFPAAVALAFSAAQAAAATRWPNLLAAATLAMVAWTPLATLGGAGRATESTPHSSADLRVAHVIQRWSEAGDTIVVWGWMSRYHVLAQRASATRHMNSEHEIRPGPYLAYHRHLYLQDLEDRQPKVFVDAVAPGSFGYADRTRWGYETFPELAAIVGDRYRLVEEVEGVRVFVRHDATTAEQRMMPPPSTPGPGAAGAERKP